MRYVLALLLWLIGSTAQAQPTWGSNTNITEHIFSTFSSFSQTVTANSGDVVYLGALWMNTATFTASGCGVTWTQRAIQGNFGSTGVLFAGVAPSALSGCTATITASATAGGGYSWYYTVGGVAPAVYDSNFATGVGTTASGTPVSVGPVTTTEALDLVSTVVLVNSTDTGCRIANGGPGTWSAGIFKNSGVNGNAMNIAYSIVTSQFSAATLTSNTPGCSGGNSYIVLYDAVTAGGGSAGRSRFIQ